MRKKQRMQRQGPVIRTPGRFAVAVLLMMAGALAGCGSESKKETLQQYPEFEIADPAGICEIAADKLQGCAYGFDVSGVMVGNKVGKVFRIINTGSRTLEISAITLEAGDAGSGDQSPYSFRVTDPDLQARLEQGESLRVAPSGQGGDDPTELNVTFEYEKVDEVMTHTALVSFVTDAANAQGGVVELTLGTIGGAPRIGVSPESVKFERVPSGETEEQRLTILNTGSQDLEVSSFQFTGSTTFTLTVQGQEYPVTAETQEGIDLTEPLVVGPQQSTDVKVKFTPINSDPATASLLLFSNDPTSTEGLLVPISGNEGLPCLTVTPSEVDFGGAVIGQLTKRAVQLGPCQGSEVPVSITGLSIKQGEGLSDAFDIDISELDHAPTAEEPVVVPVGTTVQVYVTYFPAAKLEPLEDGSLASEVGVMIVENDSFDPAAEVPLKGYPVEQLCPTAVIKCGEGEQVIPQTNLHLYGSQSYAPAGSIVKYEWSVEQPDLSASLFSPSKSFPDPTFEVNVAGTYVFHLDVWDAANVQSCEPGTYEVVVIPDDAIHVELLWHTPLDADETDEGADLGSDMDLHFAHPNANMPDYDGDGAPDPWFDALYDCYWFNAHPNWADSAPGVDDNPALDRDDTDGAGPENLNLSIPEVQKLYRIGVHYWDDNGYGSSNATVRVYIYGVLTFEVKDVTLLMDDMWYAATLDWPSAEVTAVTGATTPYSITPDYPSPFDF